VQRSGCAGYRERADGTGDGEVGGVGVGVKIYDVFLMTLDWNKATIKYCSNDDNPKRKGAYQLKYGRHI